VWVMVPGLFVCFVQIYSSQGLIVTHLTRVFDWEGFIFHLFIVSWDIAHAVFLQLLVCKKPPCDGIEAQ